MPQFQGSIGGAARVGERFAGFGELFEEGSEVVRGTVADEGQAKPFGLNGRPRVDKASNLLATKHSTKVAHEDEHHRLRCPELVNGSGSAVGIQYGEVIERRCHGVFHTVGGTPAH